MNRQMRRSLTQVLALCSLVVGLLALTVPAYAQDNTGATTSQSPAGIGILILFMGIVALFAVGGYYYTQNRVVQHPIDDEIEE